MVASPKGPFVQDEMDGPRPQAPEAEVEDVDDIEDTEDLEDFRIPQSSCTNKSKKDSPRRFVRFVMLEYISFAKTTRNGKDVNVSTLPIRCKRK